ncbi:hypothetical protein GCM10020369_15080 [Cryptosporangium minutisporangium]|uniref:Secreted protein n=1 Tax=Cryptosporangium minutisporangium TaxID=113569 RepID=A0ABP6SUA4_9ACTN
MEALIAIRLLTAVGAVPIIALAVERPHRMVYVSSKHHAPPTSQEPAMLWHTTNAMQRHALLSVGALCAGQPSYLGKDEQETHRERWRS